MHQRFFLFFMVLSTLCAFNVYPSAQSLLPKMEARLSYLEQHVRDLTGQVEELTHALHEAKQQAQDTADVRDEAPGQTPSQGPSLGQPQPSSFGEALPTLAEQNEHPETKKNAPEAALTPDQTQEQQEKKQEILPEGPVQVAYEHATSLLNQQAYDRAELAFREMIRRFPDDPLVINAYYWLGETHFKRNQFTKASVAFGEAYQFYRHQGNSKGVEALEPGTKNPVSRTKAAQSLLKLALSLKAMGQKQDACAALKELSAKFPHLPSNIKRMAGQAAGKLSCSGAHQHVQRTSAPKAP